MKKLTYKFIPYTEYVTITNGKETRKYTGQGFTLMMGYPNQNIKWMWDNFEEYEYIEV